MNTFRHGSTKKERRYFSAPSPVKQVAVFRSPRPEYMIVFAHRVIRHKQIPCVSIEIEIRPKITHHLLQIIALIDDVFGEILFRIVMPYISIVEIIHIELIAQIQEIIESLLLILRKLGILDDRIESIFIHATLRIEAGREALIILKHKLRILLILV